MRYLRATLAGGRFVKKRQRSVIESSLFARIVVFLAALLAATICPAAGVEQSPPAAGPHAPTSARRRFHPRKKESRRTPTACKTKPKVSISRRFSTSTTAQFARAERCYQQAIEDLCKTSGEEPTALRRNDLQPGDHVRGTRRLRACRGTVPEGPRRRQERMGRTSPRLSGRFRGTCRGAPRLGTARPRRAALPCGHCRLQEGSSR